MTDESDIVAERYIESAIDQHDDPDHPDAYTVAQVREAFAALQRDLADTLETYDDHSTVAYEDKELVVYVDADGTDLEHAIDAAGIDADDILTSILSNLMHAVARERSDYEWSGAYPLVVRKPLALRRGERHALNRIGHLSRDLGGLPQGTDWYACQIRGWGQRKWSEYTGRSHGAAGKNVREAQRE